MLQIFFTVLLVPVLSLSAIAEEKSAQWNRIAAVDEIYALNSNASCLTKSDCETVPMGHAPCGGPSSYLVVSKRNKNLEEIRTKAKKLTERLIEEENVERAKDWNRPDGICMVLPSPEVSCRNSKCEGASRPR